MAYPPSPGPCVACCLPVGLWRWVGHVGCGVRAVGVVHVTMVAARESPKPPKLSGERLNTQFRGLWASSCIAMREVARVLKAVMPIFEGTKINHHMTLFRAGSVIFKKKRNLNCNSDI